MVMPVETACPCRTKFTASGSASRFTSFAFAELVLDQPEDGGERGVGVLAVGLDLHRAADAGGEHHHAHDALRVDAPAAAREPDLALEAARQLSELGGSAGMQAQLVDDFRVGARHDFYPSRHRSVFMWTRPSAPPESARLTEAGSEPFLPVSTRSSI